MGSQSVSVLGMWCVCEILDREVEVLFENATFEGSEGASMQVSGGRVFQSETIVSAKALRDTKRRTAWLEQRNNEKRSST